MGASCLVCEDFERWLEVNEGRVRRWAFEPLADGTDKGRVVIYSISSFIHATITDDMGRSIVMQVQNAGNDIALMATVVSRASPTCWTGDHGQEPDFSLTTPKGLKVGGAVLAAGRGFPFPNVIVKVAFKIESLARLREKLERWMSDATSAQVEIGIKIFAVNQRRVAILRQQGLLTTMTEFGQPDVAPPLAILFPLASVHAGVALPPALAGLGKTEFSIVLIALRILIDEDIERLATCSSVTIRGVIRCVNNTTFVISYGDTYLKRLWWRGFTVNPN